jgi:hypothetical protein
MFCVATLFVYRYCTTPPPFLMFKTRHSLLFCFATSLNNWYPPCLILLRSLSVFFAVTLCVSCYDPFVCVVANHSAVCSATLRVSSCSVFRPFSVFHVTIALWIVGLPADYRDNLFVLHVCDQFKPSYVFRLLSKFCIATTLCFCCNPSLLWNATAIHVCVATPLCVLYCENSLQYIVCYNSPLCFVLRQPSQLLCATSSLCFVLWLLSVFLLQPLYMFVMQLFYVILLHM